MRYELESGLGHPNLHISREIRSNRRQEPLLQRCERVRVRVSVRVACTHTDDRRSHRHRAELLDGDAVGTAMVSYLEHVHLQA
mgnify:CR=1 FL=1